MRIWKAFTYSMSGIAAAWKGEPAFRLEALLSAVMIPAAFFVAPDRAMLALMVGSVLLALAVELINTAIEATINRIGTDIHPMSKIAKDAGSAAVLIALINAGFIWALALFY